MEIKGTWLPDSDYKLMLTRDDRETLRDVYLEDVYEYGWVAETPPDRLFKKLGKLASNNTFRNIRTIRLDAYELQQLSDSLTDYANRTPLILGEILDGIDDSPERSKSLFYRDCLGELAASLSLQIGVEIGVDLGPVEVEEELKDIYKGFRSGSE